MRIRRKRIYNENKNLFLQINALHVIYSVKVIDIFDVKVVDAIYLRVYTLRHYGTIFHKRF